MPGRWITLEPSGTHVHLDSGGDIDKGPAAIEGKKPSKLKDRKKVKAPSVKPSPLKKPEQEVSKAEQPKEAAADYKKNGTKSKAFKSWFGDWEADPANASKVINKQTGEPEETSPTPAVMYHGTQADFDAFDPSKIGSATDPGDWGAGFYFTPSKDMAEMYSKMGKNPDKGKVLTLNLNIRKPLEVKSSSGELEEGEFADFLAGEYGKEKVSEWIKKETSLIDLIKNEIGSVEFTELAKKHSHDGIFVMAYGDKEPKQIIAFEPTQVKAVDNEGTFDPKSEDLHKSVAVVPACPRCQSAVKSNGLKVYCSASLCGWHESPLAFVKSLLDYETKSEGTCKQGERSDLTGCTPASGEPGAAKPAGTESNDTEQPAAKQPLYKRAMGKAKAALSKLNAAVDKLTDRRGLRWVQKTKDFTGKMSAMMYTGMEKRYGRKQAVAIMASAQVLGWGALGVGAVIGIPLYLPGVSFWGSIPAAALAETYIQASNGVKLVAGAFSGKAMEQELSPQEIEEAAKEFLREFAAEYNKYLESEKGEITAAFPEQKQSVKPSPFHNRKSLFGVKSEGQPCKQGETAEQSGCVPANDEELLSNSDTISADKPKNKKPKAVISKVINGKDWLASYVHGGEEGTVAKGKWTEEISGLPNDEVVKEFTAYVPDKPVTLYRYVPMMEGSGSTGQELKSWSRSEEYTQSMFEDLYEGKGKVVKKLFYPNEILVDTTLLPDEYEDAQSASQEEVIVAYGATLKRMKQLRGTDVTVTPSPFAHRKTMSAYDNNAGGALVPPPSLGIGKRRKSSLIVSPLVGRKSLVFYFGKAHQIGVPFQGPSGLWFVARPPNGKVVRAKNPNAPVPSGGRGAGPSNFPAGPLPAPATPTAPSSGTPANSPAPAAGSSPLGPKAAAAAAVKAKIQQVLGSTYQKLVGNMPLSAADLAALPSQFAQLSSNDLRSLNYILKNAGLMGLQHAQNRGPRLAVLMAYAQGAGLAGVAAVAPVPAVPQPAIPAPVPAPTPIPPSPIAAPTPPAHVVTPPASPPVPAPTPPSPTPAVTPSTPAVPKKRTSKVSGKDADKDDLDDLVEAAVQKMGGSIDYGNVMKDYNTQSAILRAIQNEVDGSVYVNNIFISLRSLWQQTTKDLIPPLYNHTNVSQGKNYKLDDTARPNLTKDEQVAIQKYTGTAYRMLNKSMRDDGKPTARTQHIHDDLQKAFAKVKPFSAPVQVLRGLQLSKATTGKLIACAQAAITSGGPIAFNQYLSTSTNPSLNPRWPDNVELSIKAVEGLDARPYSHCPGMSEMIMNYDSQFTVKSVKQVGGKWHIEMEQLPSASAGKPSGSTTAKGKYSPPVNYAFGRLPKTKPAAVPAAAKTSKAPKPHKFADVKSSKAVADFLSGTKRYTLHSNTAKRGEDIALNDIMKEAGRAEKPKVMDKTGIDNLKTQGWKVFYRGVTDKMYTDQFRNGDLYNGSGVYGNGTYGASVSDNSGGDDGAKQTAKSYAGYGNTNGAIMRFAMPPNAKIITDAGVKKMCTRYLNKLRTEWRAGTITTSEYTDLAEITKDRGRFAALHNYDAIDASKPSSDGYYVILNRSILAVEDKDQ